MKNFIKILATISIATFAIVYAISPVDIVPDIIPIAGQADDVVVLGTAVVAIIKIWKK